MKKQINLLNKLRKKILNKYSVGWLQIPSLESLNILENRYDWFCIDYEHGFISQDKLGEMISLINKSNKVPLVRLASTDSRDSIKIIEAGASGIVIPQVKMLIMLKKSLMLVITHL